MILGADGFVTGVATVVAAGEVPIAFDATIVMVTLVPFTRLPVVSERMPTDVARQVPETHTV